VRKTDLRRRVSEEDFILRAISWRVEIGNSQKNVDGRAGIG
jgi:hypothetical protein